MVVQQVGDAKTRKGDPHFMQNLNTAWSKASQDTKNKLKNCVHVSNGKVVRIDAPKSFPELEKFVRTFADGKAYIGVGAWNGQIGNANDNNQVSDPRFPSLDYESWQLTAPAELCRPR